MTPNLSKYRLLAVTHAFAASLGLTGCPDDSSSDPTTEGADTDDSSSGGTVTQGSSSTTSDDPVTTGGPPTTSVGPSTTDDSITDGVDTSSTTAGDSTTGDSTTGDSTTGDSTTTTTGDSTTGDSTTGDTTGDPVVELPCFLEDALPNVRTPGRPGGLVLADFDGDGKDDIAARITAASKIPGSVHGITVHRSLGGGLFAPEDFYPAGHPDDSQWGSWSLVAADFDGDDKLDLATIEYDTEAVKVFLNQGDGSFGAPALYPGIEDPQSLVAADFDGDGELDIVVRRDHDVVVMLNLGGGSFGPTATSPHQGSSYLSAPMHTADLDDDGKLDLVVPSFDTNTVQLLFNQGDGLFGAPVAVPAGVHPSSAASVDLDQDGDLDLVVGLGGEAKALVAVLHNLGAGAFAPPTLFSTGIQTWVDTTNIVVADLDADGHADIVANGTMGGGGGLSVLHNDGQGGFVPHSKFVAGAVSVGLGLSDVDADGRLDVVVGNTYDHAISVLRQNPNGTFGASPPQIDPETAFKTLVEDFDGDGVLDVATFWGENTRLLRGNGDGSFEFQAEHTFAGNSFEDPTIVDLDGDGDKDIVSAAGSVLRNEGDGSFTAATYPAGIYRLAIADFDGDARLDLAAAGTSVAVLFGNGDASFGPATHYLSPTIVHTIEAADFNSDGKPDLAITDDSEDLPPRAVLLLNDGTGKFTPQTLLTDTPYAPTLVARDFDDDGAMDLAVKEDEDVRILLGQGDGQFVDLGVHDHGAENANNIYTADLDQDGVLDVIVPDTVQPFIGVSRGKGDGTFEPAVALSTNVRHRSDSLVIRDLNGDDALDLFIGGLGVATLLNQGDGTFGPATSFTTLDAHPGPAAGDLDGDSVLDIVLGGSSAYLLRGSCR